MGRSCGRRGVAGETSISRSRPLEADCAAEKPRRCVAHRRGATFAPNDGSTRTGPDEWTMSDQRAFRKAKWSLDFQGDQIMYVLPLFMLFAIVCAVLVSCAS